MPGREDQLKRNMQEGFVAIQRILKRAQRTIKGTVAEFAGDKRIATSATLRDRMYKTLSGEYQILGSNIDAWTRDSVNQTARQWWRYAKTDLPNVGTFGAFSEKHLEDILGMINPSIIAGKVAVNAQASNMLASDIRVLRAAVSTTFAEGSIEGLNNRQLAERMTDKLIKAAGQFTFLDKAGRSWTADNYFGMLNRTLHATTARQAYFGAASDAGFDLYVIAGGVTGSSQDNPEDPCDKWAGRIYSLTGNTPGFPTYQDVVDAGVYHPRCVHYARAVLESEIGPDKRIKV